MMPVRVIRLPCWMCTCRDPQGTLVTVYVRALRMSQALEAIASAGYIREETSLVVPAPFEERRLSRKERLASAE